MWELSTSYLRNLALYVDVSKSDVPGALEDQHLTDMKELRKFKYTGENVIKRLVLDYPSKDVMKEIYVPKNLYDSSINDVLSK